MKKRIIVFVETGEVRPPKANEWYLYGRHPQQAMSGHDNVARANREYWTGQVIDALLVASSKQAGVERAPASQPTTSPTK